MARPTRAQQIANYKSFLVEEGYEIIKQETYRCRKCGEYKPKKDFYETMNPKMDINGIMSICKDCANEIVDDYFKIFQNFEKAMLYACEDLDVVYYEPSIEALKTRMANAIRGGKEFNGLFGQYKSSIAQNKNNINGFRFRDSDVYVDKVQEVKEKVKSMLESTEDLSDEDKDSIRELEIKWGEGYSEKEYDYLESRFDALTEMANVEYEVDSMLIKNICLEELELRTIRSNKGDTKKKVETIAILMRDANIRPTDIKNANSDLLNDSYGKWLNVIEEYEPAEFFKDKPLFDDFDELKKYFSNHVLRPLKNILKGVRDFVIKE